MIMNTQCERLEYCALGRWLVHVLAGMGRMSEQCSLSQSFRRN